MVEKYEPYCKFRTEENASCNVTGKKVSCLKPDRLGQVCMLYYCGLGKIDEQTALAYMEALNQIEKIYKKLASSLSRKPNWR